MPGVAFLSSGRKLRPAGCTRTLVRAQRSENESPCSPRPGGAYGPYAVVVIRLGESCEFHIVATGNGFIYALLLRGCDGII